MHRLFVAIRPPEPIRDLLIDAMDDSADFRWQAEDQLILPCGSSARSTDR